jgi:hypothetical protein
MKKTITTLAILAVVGGVAGFFIYKKMKAKKDESNINK